MGDYLALDALIAQARAKNPAERLQSMQALIAGLQALHAPAWWASRSPRCAIRAAAAQVAAVRLLFACKATGKVREKTGAKRIPENNCLKLKSSR